MLVPATAAASPLPAGAGNGFTAVTPTRVLDTRTSGGPVQADSTRVLDLSSQVPANATAVLLNVTATDISTGGFVTVYPDGTAVPITSNLNLAPGRDIPNAVTVRLRSNHKVDLYNKVGTVDLVADLEGYYAPTSTTGLTAQAPTRVLDTRNGIGPLGPQATYTLDLSGSVPANATAAVLNLTGVSATANTFVTAWPHGTPRPATSSLNAKPGLDIPNAVTVPLGAGGKIDLYNNLGSLDLVADLAGYYAPTSTSTFSTIISSRAIDTRKTSPVGGGALTVDLSGVVPPTTTAVTLNLTATNATANTFVTATPHGTPRPNASNVNLRAGQTASNSVTVGVSQDGKIDLYNNLGATDLIVDVYGYFAPPFTCTAGCVYGWGWTYLGNRADVDEPVSSGIPGLLFGLNDIVSVDNVVETNVGYALRADGTLWAWGGDSYGDLGNGASCSDPNYPTSSAQCFWNVPVHVLGLDHVTAVAGDAYTAFALKSDGTVWHIGAPSTQVPGLTGVTAIAGGVFTDYALKSDGTVWSWGRNLAGELGIGTETNDYTEVPVQVRNLTGVTAISADKDGTALRDDGTVWVWGPDAKAFTTGNPTAGESSLPVQVTGLTGVTAISGQHALKADGTVWSWGDDTEGQLGDNTKSTTLQATPVQAKLSGAVALAKHLNGAVLSDGTGRLWGDNLFGELGGGNSGGECDSPTGQANMDGLTVLALSGSQAAGYALTR
jgi:hypothetical protein